MDKKYQQYSVEDFTQDLYFINWVKRGDKKDEWDLFIRENPDKLQVIETAKKIVDAFRYNETKAKDEEMYEVWNKIDAFHSSYHQTKRRNVWKKVLPYAAVLLLAFTIGVTLLVYFSSTGDQFDQFANVPTNSSGDAKLILAGGEEILLKEKQTELRFDKEGKQLKIDQDSIVNCKEGTGENVMARMMVPYGKRSDIQLSDGTMVSLNAGSQLIFPHRFTGKYRKVYLKGEAYFAVTKNKEQPFVVSSDDMNITVLGTEFNLKNNDLENEMEVVLVEGAVSIKENSSFYLSGKEIRLKPNQKAVFNKQDNTAAVESDVNVQYYISWKNGLLEFDKESIINVFNKLSRYYNIRFVTESDVELNQKISGKLDLKDSLEAVMKVVADAALVTYRIEENVVFVNRKVSYLPMR